MAFKGEIGAEFLDNVKTGFTVGDIYRIINAGKLGGVDIPFGTFVEWKGTGWEVKKNMQYAVSKTGESLDDTAVNLEEVFFANMDVPASTLRFSFGDLNYDPTQDTAVASRHDTADRAGGGTPAGYGGTWKKLRTKYTNIWDYTYVDNTLLNEFDNGNYGYEATPATRFWNDVEHNPIKVIASNTAGCKSFKRAFQGCWAITEIWELDMSDATAVGYAFCYCKNLVTISKLDMSSATNFDMIFGYCFNLESIDGIELPDDNTKTYRGSSTFVCCYNLKNISGTLDLQSFTNIDSMFGGCLNLHELSIENTDRIKNFSNTFKACKLLSFDVINALDTSAATNMSAMLSGQLILGDAQGHRFVDILEKMNNVVEVPQFDYSNVTDCSYMFSDCNILEIDATKLSTLTGSVNVTAMFRRNRNCKSGIQDAYAVLDAVDSNHTDCFKNCGIDTEEGRAELEQIPVSWGGLAP